MRLRFLSSNRNKTSEARPIIGKCPNELSIRRLTAGTLADVFGRAQTTR